MQAAACIFLSYRVLLNIPNFTVGFVALRLKGGLANPPALLDINAYLCLAAFCRPPQRGYDSIYRPARPKGEGYLRHKGGGPPSNL